MALFALICDANCDAVFPFSFFSSRRKPSHQSVLPRPHEVGHQARKQSMSAFADRGNPEYNLARKPSTTPPTPSFCAAIMKTFLTNCGTKESISHPVALQFQTRFPVQMSRPETKTSPLSN